MTTETRIEAKRLARAGKVEEAAKLGGVTIATAKRWARDVPASRAPVAEADPKVVPEAVKAKAMQDKVAPVVDPFKPLAVPGRAHPAETQINAAALAALKAAAKATGRLRGALASEAILRGLAAMSTD